MTEIEIDRLHVSTCDVTPRNIDWHPEGDERDWEDRPQWWEPFTYELDEREVTLIAHSGEVIGAILNNWFYEREDYETYVADREEEIEALLTEREFEGLFDISPYQWGSEGPMMNYWYPIEEKEYEFGHAGSFSPVGAARKLIHSPLVVVLVDGEYGIALAGGGMDFSWEICEAFVLLGKCPPLHFLDLPHMADTWREMHERVYQGAQRTLEFTINHANRVKERLDDYRAKQTGGDA